MRRAMRMALMYNNSGATNRRRRDRRGRYMEGGGYGARNEYGGSYGYEGGEDAYVMPQGRRMGFAQDMNDNDIRRRNTGTEEGWFSEQGEDERYPTSRYGRSMMAGGGGGNMQMMRGHAGGQMSKPQPLTREMAEEWVDMMEGESEGETWSFEEIKEIAKKHGMPDQEQKIVELYAVMNMLASDYYKVAEKFDVLNDDFFACMAKAFINDEDAVPNKVAAYYQYIVKKD